MSPVSSVVEALANCARTHTWSVGMCGQFCAAMYGYPASGYASALVQWQNTPSSLRQAGSQDAPPGALYYWGGGSHGYGHVAVAVGDGSCYSIDIGGAGTVTRVPVGTVTTRWGMPYLGWAYPYFSGKEWTPAMIYGLDVASFQSDHFPLTLPGDGKKVDFAFIKATQGTSYVNPRLVAQTAWSRSNGLVTGFYHFLETGNIQAQVNYFLSRAGASSGDLLACDWETDPSARTYPTNAEKDAFIKAVQAARPDCRVLLYCNTTFWTGIDKTSFAGDGLWIATGGYPAGKPPIKASWAVHQYSTSGDIDHDVASFASRAAMADWAQKGGADVALTADDKAWITDLLVSKAYKATIGKDAARSPDDDPANPYWMPESYLRETFRLDRDTQGLVRAQGDTLTQILAQVKANGQTLSAIKAALDSIVADPNGAAARLKQALESLEVHFQVTQPPTA